MNLFLEKNSALWALFGCLLLGIGLGALGMFLFFSPPPTGRVTPLRQSDLTSNTAYRFIDPILGLKNSDQSTSQDYSTLKNNIDAFVAAEKKAGHMEIASVSFRDIAASSGFSINSAEQYNPASLIKVPTMMAYLNLAQKDPSILSHKLVYFGHADSNTQEHFVSATQLIPGNTYTIEELIEHMIKYSDNNAGMMLINYLNATGGENALNHLFTDLGLNKIDLSDDYITMGGFTLFFRVLYNSTYLSRDMSEKALELLAQTDFTGGLAAGVPAGIAVAHKFGEFTVLTEQGALVKHELHDCGYVYYPRDTYLLCIMTKGDDFSELRNAIAGISGRVYAFMQAKYPEAE